MTPARRRGAAWKVSIHKNADGHGSTWSAWIDLPNGYSATSYYPDSSRREAELTARHFREGMKRVAPPARKKKKGGQ